MNKKNYKGKVQPGFLSFLLSRIQNGVGFVKRISLSGLSLQGTELPNPGQWPFQTQLQRPCEGLCFVNSTVSLAGGDKVAHKAYISSTLSIPGTFWCLIFHESHSRKESKYLPVPGTFNAGTNITWENYAKSQSLLCNQEKNTAMTMPS